MEEYIKKAADAFLVERPYGMRVDYSKQGYVPVSYTHLDVYKRQGEKRFCMTVPCFPTGMPSSMAEP